MFEVIDDLVDAARSETPVVLVDVHAEATSEKAALARWLDGRVTAVVGTHTHVQTSDATILPKGTAFITDAGMTGPHDSVIGVEAELAIRRMRTGLPVRFETAQGGVRIEGVVVTCDAETGRASGIEAVRVAGLLSRRRLRQEEPQEHERGDPREIEVEPVGQRELERDEHRRGERRELHRPFAAWDERDDDREQTASTSTTGCRKPRSGMPRAWYWPQPQIENGESRADWYSIVRSQNVRTAPQSDGSSTRIAKASTVATPKPARNRAARRSSSAGYAPRAAPRGATRTWSSRTARRPRRAPSRRSTARSRRGETRA